MATPCPCTSQFPGTVISSPQDMGKVMGVATKKLAGKAEGRAISAKVKELLG